MLAWADKAKGGGSGSGWRNGKLNGPHLSKLCQGVRTRLGPTSPPPPEHPMPDELHFVIDRARKLVLPPPGSVSTGNKPRKQPSLAQWRPNEANAILYQRGSGHVLGAHCDHRAMSGPILATLSLAGEATMTYTKAQQPPAERHRVTLPRRSIQIQTGTVARFGTSLCMASTTRTCRRRLASGYQ